MATERVLSNLNLISFKTEGGLQNHIDELQDGDLAFTPDNSLKGVLFDFKWADHLLNDLSWLRADTFSWQSGDVYVAAYNHLIDDFRLLDVVIDGTNYWAYKNDSANPSVVYVEEFVDFFAPGGAVYYYDQDGNFSVLTDDTSGTETSITADGTEYIRSQYSTEQKTETIDGTTITYYLAEDGHKICLPDQEDKVLALYNATGVAWYYILDTANKQFKLPRSKHNKYADTVPVAGNGMTLGLTDGQDFAGLQKGTDTWQGQTFGYSVYGTNVGTTGASWDHSNSKSWGVTPDQTKSGIIAQQEQDTDQYKYLYFYVGNFERDAVEQTAGIAAEMFNSKADSDLKNIPANYDYVVESQMPTAENGYTWYRKYKSGWVEQGGKFSKMDTLNLVITLPIEMSTNVYSIIGIGNIYSNASGHFTPLSATTTSFTANIGGDGGNGGWWQVCGMSAQ